MEGKWRQSNPNVSSSRRHKTIMALKLLSSPLPRPRWSSSSSSYEGDYRRHFNQWVVGRREARRSYNTTVVVIRASSLIEESISCTTTTTTNSALLLHQLPPPLYLLSDGLDLGYSQASYYTSLGLFVISVPGLWSLIKRSVKSKIVQKTFIVQEGAGKRPNQMAGEIVSYFARNNFVVLDRADTITFDGMMVPSRSQAALLIFCTCISLASIALVLTITFPDIGNNWFYLTALSPLAGVYYWTRASRKEQIKVKIMLADDGSLSEIIVQGDDQQVDQMRRELQLIEKGMIYVKGIFER